MLLERSEGAGEGVGVEKKMAEGGFSNMVLIRCIGYRDHGGFLIQ